MKQMEQKPQNNVENRKKRYFSLLTIVLIVCIIQLTLSGIQNINKSINFSSKIKNLEKKRDEETAKNKQLKSEIENFDSAATLESIARNNLKMAGEDEVLIIINEPKEQAEEEQEATNKKTFFKKNKKTVQ